MASYKLTELAEEDVRLISARSFPAQKHTVYYWKSEQGIEVARILHKRMNVLAAFE